MTYNPTATKSELASYMRPSSEALYPTTDVVSYTCTTSAPGYTGQYSINWNNSDAALRFRYSPSSFTDAAGNGVNAISGATAAQNYTWTSYEVEFFVNGADLAILTLNLATVDYRIYVDDMPMEATWSLITEPAYSPNYIKIQFATSRVRKIRLLFGAWNSFTSIILPGASDVWAAPPRFRVAMTGDSYVQGNYGTSEGNISAGTISNELAIQTGWEVLNLGQGSTGYTVNDGNNIGRDYYGAASRLAALAALPALDLIIIFGGGNDANTSVATVVAAANTMWNAVKAARPTTPIIVVGIEPGSPTGFITANMDTLNAALKAAAAANQNVSGYIDMRAGNWVTGTGYMGAPVDDGNQDFLISSDGVHPSHAGSKNIASRMVDDMRKMRV